MEARNQGEAVTIGEAVAAVIAKLALSDETGSRDPTPACEAVGKSVEVDQGGRNDHATQSTSSFAGTGS